MPINSAVYLVGDARITNRSHLIPVAGVWQDHLNDLNQGALIFLTPAGSANRTLDLPQLAMVSPKHAFNKPEKH